MHQTFIIKGGNALKGRIKLSGAKNVALKALAAALLTTDEVRIENVPLITDLKIMSDIVRSLGAEVKINNSEHTAIIKASKISGIKVDLDKGAHLRTSSMLVVPLLVRQGKAVIPNPGGCRIGARPIDRHIEGLSRMGAEIIYNRQDGYFYAQTKGLVGTRYRFKKNTHTGTETMLLAAVLAKGTTILENAATEPEIDDLIKLLCGMGAKIKRFRPRSIWIEGVKRLKGTSHRIMSDRNEAVTFAIAAYITGGDLLVEDVQKEHLTAFLAKLDEAGAFWQEVDASTLRFAAKGKLKPTQVVTAINPGFMTDWQAPWCLLMTQAEGVSTIHETIFEDRFGYVKELRKCGADIELFNPPVEKPEQFYNFNWSDNKSDYFHAARIKGPTPLHNAVLDICDLRAGATLVLAAMGAKGTSILHGVEHIDRGYESLDLRLNKLGASIKRQKEEITRVYN